MKRNVFYSITAVLFGSFLSFTSCDNKTETDFNLNDLDIELAQDDAVAEDVYNTVDAMIDDEVAALDENNFTSTTEFKSTDDSDDEPFVCKVVTVDRPNDSTQFPKILTIDYGEGCTIEINGNKYTRKGKIQIEISDRRCELNAIRTTTFIDFYINEINIQGTHTVTCLGLNENGNMEFRHELSNGKIVFNDSIQYTRNSITVRERVRSETRRNDTIFVSGGGDGINADGNAYQYEITERLMLLRCAEYRNQWAIVSGIIEVTRSGESSLIDFGNGTCGDEANLIIDGRKHKFNKRERYHHRRIFSGI